MVYNHVYGLYHYTIILCNISPPPTLILGFDLSGFNFSDANFISLVASLGLCHKGHLPGTSHGSKTVVGLLPTLTHLFWTILHNQLERQGLVSHSADRK